MSSHSQISSWLADTLNNYLEYISPNKSRTTVDAYGYDVAKFLEYVASKNVKRVTALKSDHIVGYLGYCKNDGKSDSSVNRYYMSLRSFCRFLRKTKAVERDLTEDVEAPRNIQKAAIVPTTNEVERILEQPDTETERGSRDKAILELLYSSGLRASELCDLNLSDWQGNKILVRCGKRGKTRTVPVTVYAQESITRYIIDYRGDHEGYLFETATGKQMTRQRLCKAVTTYAKTACVSNVTTHTLRHACATHLLDEGAELIMIQKVLGHSSIASTQRYTHLSSMKIQEMFKTFHPRKEGKRW